MTHGPEKLFDNGTFVNKSIHGFQITCSTKDYEYVFQNQK